MAVSPVDVLVFGPHPDDIEIGAGGTVAHLAAKGQRVGLCDLTAGEMGSNGTVEERLAEADAAGDVLGAAWRVNLRWRDRAIGKDPDHVRAAASLIRAARPRSVALPYWSDRHPDHVAASAVLTEAAFSAGLRRFETEHGAWKAEWICYYFINDSAHPSFVVDVSQEYEIKRRALACHASQFTPPHSRSGGTSAAQEREQRPGEQAPVATRLNTPRFLQLVESRDAQFGALADVAFAEGFVVKDPVVRADLFR
jgi:bacillithiol biosynthesis deacetylase BshB1